MKIACLTFHNSSNYGTALQAYALQTAVEKLGYSYFIIDYSNPQKLKFDSLLGKNKELNFLLYIFKLLSFPINVYKKMLFLNFTKKYLHLTRKCYSHSDLNALNSEFEFFLCGSDQVWNLDMIRNDTAYFLSFVSSKSRKASYAASIGRIEVNDDKISFYKRQLLDLSRIAVREKSAALFILSLSIDNVKVVLDPTLLLNKDDWSKIAILPHNNEKYILVYVLSYNIEIVNFIEQLSAQTNLKVVYIYRNLGAFFREGARSIPSPSEWVGLFMNATYIITNSFHGTAFSVNFNKIFFSFIKGSGAKGTNSRLYDFLSMLKLEHRLNVSATRNTIDLSPPDFTFANEVIKEMRLDSEEYLKGTLSCDQNK